MRQLTDMFKGLMFLQGHFVQPHEGHAASRLGNRDASARWFAGHAGTARKPADSGFSLIEQLAFLGGRPMRAGHNFDIDDGFEQLTEENPTNTDFSLVEQLTFLGGRPMHAGHNFDIDDGFDQLAEAANDDAPPVPVCKAC